METRISREIRVFLKRHGMPVLTLAKLSGVHHSILVRVLKGSRDMTSTNADNVRDAMLRYEAMHNAFRQSDGED